MVTARVGDNVMNWSVFPLSDQKETDAEDMDRIISQARVVAGNEVYQRLNELTKVTGDFYRQLFPARLHHQRVREEGKVDDGESIALRVSLAGVAERIAQSHKEIEAAIRREMGRD
jgi:hypothetical protein